MAATTSKVKVTLKLLINKNTNKVLFAEAGNEFVDFFFTLLSFPFGTISEWSESPTPVGLIKSQISLSPSSCTGHQKQHMRWIGNRRQQHSKRQEYHRVNRHWSTSGKRSVGWTCMTDFQRQKIRVSLGVRDLSDPNMVASASALTGAKVDSSPPAPPIDEIDCHDGEGDGDGDSDGDDHDHNKPKKKKKKKKNDDTPGPAGDN
ncbi:hypothetical protein LINPERHAP1_LOCUS33138 [Linum perenne]